jgi:hypothetical protein
LVLDIFKRTASGHLLHFRLSSLAQPKQDIFFTIKQRQGVPDTLPFDMYQTFSFDRYSPIFYGAWVLKNCRGAAGVMIGDMLVFVTHGPVRLVACSRFPMLQFTCRFEPDFWMVGDGIVVRTITALM